MLAGFGNTRTDDVEREAHLTRLACAVAFLLLAAPLGAEAQQREKVARVGILRSSDALQPYKIAALQKGLSEYGYVAVIEGRYAEGKFDQLPGLAADLVRMPVDIIVAPDNAGAQAARKATSTIPIVLAGQGDPVGAGLVSSLARPGGNVTGVSAALGDAFPGKWVELVKEALPRVSRVGVIWNPANR